MLEKFTDGLYSQMQEQLMKINGSLKESAPNLVESLTVVDGKIELLKKHILENPFENEQQEISFFKYVKPRFYCWHIYLVELHYIVAAVPIGTDQMIKNYYMDELGVVNRCFNIYQFSYQYYLHDESLKDPELFLRKNRTRFPVGQENLTYDSEFTTNHDFLYSKFRAYEMLRDFIIRRLRLLYENPDDHFVKELLAARNRWWSGDKVELIELAYGIYYTNRINGGKAEINEVIQWLEDSLHIDLSQAYRMFLDIKRRKTISHTKYLDEMRNAVHQHIEDSFAFKARKRTSKI